MSETFQMWPLASAQDKNKRMNRKGGGGALGRGHCRYYFVSFSMMDDAAGRNEGASVAYSFITALSVQLYSSGLQQCSS